MRRWIWRGKGMDVRCSPSPQYWAFPHSLTPLVPLTAPLAPFFCMFDLGSISPRFTTFYHLGSSAGGRHEVG